MRKYNLFCSKCWEIQSYINMHDIITTTIISPNNIYVWTQLIMFNHQSAISTQSTFKELVINDIEWKLTNTLTSLRQHTMLQIYSAAYIMLHVYYDSEEIISCVRRHGINYATLLCINLISTFSSQNQIHTANQKRPPIFPSTHLSQHMEQVDKAYFQNGFWKAKLQNLKSNLPWKDSPPR